MIGAINQTSSNLYSFQWTLAKPAQAVSSASTGAKGVESTTSERRETLGSPSTESRGASSQTQTSNPVEALRTMATNEIVPVQAQSTGLSGANQMRGLQAYAAYSR
jgi:hypothetical protein